MSLYIGKSNIGENIVHISKNHQDKEVLQNGINENTVFLSTMPLSSYRLIPVSRSYYRTYYNFYKWRDSGIDNAATVETPFCRASLYGDEDETYVPITGAHAYNIAGSDMNFLIDTLKTTPDRVMFLDSNMNVVSNCGIVNIMLFTGFSTGWGQYWTSRLVYGCTLAIADFYGATAVPPVSYILILRDNLYPGVKGDVYIDNSGIYVGGNNILKGKDLLSNYYVPGSNGIRVTDSLVLVPSTVTQQGNLSIVNDKNGVTTVSLGDTPIFDSRHNYYAPSKHTSKVVQSYNIDFSIHWQEKLLYTLKENESYCSVQMPRHLYNGIYLYPSVIVFRGQNSRCLLSSTPYAHPYTGRDVQSFDFIEIRGNNIYYMYFSTFTITGFTRTLHITAY